MKCDKCFFCTHIGKGIYADFPVKYCKYRKEYKLPFIWAHENGALTQRRLDFSKMSDCKIWHETGCDIHPNTVAKAKREFIKRLEAEEEQNED